jgi:hypothetical protein
MQSRSVELTFRGMENRNNKARGISGHLSNDRALGGLLNFSNQMPNALIALLLTYLHAIYSSLIISKGTVEGPKINSDMPATQI